MNIINAPNNINFNGTWRGAITVQKKSYLYFTRNNGKAGKFHFVGYRPKTVNVVEIDKDDSEDMWALKKMIALWGKKSIVQDLFNSYSGIEEDSIFVFTTQKNKYDKLRSKNILGYLQVQDTTNYDSVDIDVLQTKPSLKYKNLFKKIPFLNRAVQYLRKYHDVGKGMLKYTEDELCSGRKIDLYSLSGAIPFYEKYGLKHTDSNDTRVMSLERRG